MRVHGLTVIVCDDVGRANVSETIGGFANASTNDDQIYTKRSD